MDVPRCRTCVYWQKRTDMSGECRRHAACHGNDEVFCDFRRTSDDDWCGDHHLFAAYLAYITMLKPHLFAAYLAYITMLKPPGEIPDATPLS